MSCQPSTSSSAAARHQVLVYSGSGTSPLSAGYTVQSLTALLSPWYTVQPITISTLTSEPWEQSCALLVMPGGRDLPFVKDFFGVMGNGVAGRRVKQWMEAQGGRYLGICAGAYFAAKEVVFEKGTEMEVTGAREFAFFPGQCRGTTYPHFNYGTEQGAQAISIKLPSGKSLDHLYYNGGGSFIPPASSSSSDWQWKPLAHYISPVPAGGDDMNLAAVESTSPGPSSQPKGKAVLTSIHLEYPLAGPPARSLTRATVSDEAIAKADSERLEWFGNLLESLDLRLPGRAKPSGLAAAMGNLSLNGMTDDVEKLLHPTHPLPMFLFTNPALGSELASSIFLGPGPISERLEPATSGVRVLKDANDTFHLTALGPESSDVSSALVHARNTPPPAPPVVEDDGSEEAKLPPNPQAVFDAMPKHIYLPSSSAISRDWTPLWDLERYWQALSQARAAASRRTVSVAQTGDVLCYGEAVTSTQTMLDRNPTLLNHLPTPFVSLATFQLSGRGRGSNIWLSPAGCLQFSILLDLPQSLSKHVVFVQYLMALAVCEGLDEDGRLGVRIKWPNDIYAYAEGIGGAPKGEKGRVKIGGILVNSSYTKGKFKLVVGCGVNVLNALPTTSLAHLHDLYATRLADAGSSRTPPQPPTMEDSLAKILVSFQGMWDRFVTEGGFEGFMGDYLSRWLHTNQEVTLTTTTPHTPLRILSITPDHGLLRCVAIKPKSSSGLTPLYGDRDSFGEDSANREYIDLQPDGNSFDLMSGMIRRKV